MNVMIDLETFGNKPGAVIVALGAVKFGPEGLGETFYTRIDPESCVALGMTLDASTVQWWLGQSEEARLEIKKPGRSVDEALKNFSYWLGDDRALMWGNGAAFDNVILAAAYQKAGIAVPWKFWNDRCYRTVKALRPDVPLIKQGVAHNALDDACSQAVHLQEILWPSV